MVDQIVPEIEENLESTPARRLEELVSDAFAFVQSAEANQALKTVTLEELMGDQIKRNGESSESNSSQYNPYSYDAKEKTPAGAEPPSRANFLGGTDTGLPTKLDRITAIQNEISAVVEEIKNKPVIEVAGVAEYIDASGVAAEDGEG